MGTFTKAGCILLAGTFTLAAADSLAAQTRPVFPHGERLSLRARAGGGVPVGTDLKGITDPGGSVGGGLAYHFSPNFALRGDVVFSFLDRTIGPDRSTAFPSVTLEHYTAGVEVNFWQENRTLKPFTSTLNIGAGITRMDVDESSLGGLSPALAAFDGRYFTVTTGAMAGYQVNPRVNLFVESQAYLILADSQDTAAFSRRSGEVVAFTDTWSMALNVGTRISLF